ncbi:MAG: acetate--CoA ligase family protein [Nitrospinae bacterium]|nr:acetate--CoA ligase family protein [Nitrospinota bacterium]
MTSQVITTLHEHLSAQHKVVPEDAAKWMMREYGLAIPGGRRVSSVDEAVAVARVLGFPVAVKALSPDILHKTELHAVRVGLRNVTAVRGAVRDMDKFLRAQAGIRLEGFLVEEMVPAGIELIIGLQNDAQFGPVIMVGLGGIFTEVFQDVVFRMLPIRRADALAMLDGLRGKDILRGYRGGEAIPEELLADLLCNVARFGVDAAPYYESVDLNPIVLFPHGHRVLDAKILLRRAPAGQAIPEPFDLVVVTVDLRQVPQIMQESAARGACAMLIISGGGKELGGERAALEQEINVLSRRLSLRVIGPNCIGVFNAENRFDAFFQSHERMLRPKAGPVAFLSQSGTFGASFVEDLASVGVSKMISYGNRVDVDEADLIAYLGDDPATTVIGCYVEGLSDGRKFVTTAAHVIRQKRKPVVVWKSGRTPRGARAAMSHTGFFGGSYAVYEGAFKQAGVLAVDSYEELFAVCKALAWQPAAQGNRIAMLSNGAGPMVTAIDLCGSYGLEVAVLEEATEKAMAAQLPSFYLSQNPVDVTGSGTAREYQLVIEAFLQDPQVDIVMPWFVFQDTPLEEEIIQYLAEFHRERRKPLLCGGIGGPYTAKMSAAIEAEHLPVYHTIRGWVAAAAGLARWGQILSQNAGPASTDHINFES